MRDSMRALAAAPSQRGLFHTSVVSAGLVSAGWAASTGLVSSTLGSVFSVDDMLSDSEGAIVFGNVRMDLQFARGSRRQVSHRSPFEIISPTPGQRFC